MPNRWAERAAEGKRPVGGIAVRHTAHRYTTSPLLRALPSHYSSALSACCSPYRQVSLLPRHWHRLRDRHWYGPDRRHPSHPHRRERETGEGGESPSADLTHPRVTVRVARAGSVGGHGRANAASAGFGARSGVNRRPNCTQAHTHTASRGRKGEFGGKYLFSCVLPVDRNTFARACPHGVPL